MDDIERGSGENSPNSLEAEDVVMRRFESTDDFDEPNSPSPVQPPLSSPSSSKKIPLTSSRKAPSIARIASSDTYHNSPPASPSTSSKGISSLSRQTTLISPSSKSHAALSPKGQTIYSAFGRTLRRPHSPGGGGGLRRSSSTGSSTTNSPRSPALKKTPPKSSSGSVDDGESSEKSPTLPDTPSLWKLTSSPGLILDCCLAIRFQVPGELRVLIQSYRHKPLDNTSIRHAVRVWSRYIAAGASKDNNSGDQSQGLQARRSRGLQARDIQEFNEVRMLYDTLVQWDVSQVTDAASLLYYKNCDVVL